MKKQLFKLLFASLITTMAIAACSKKADAPGPGPGGSGGPVGGTITKEKLLGSYKITELNEVSASGTFDYLETESPCDKDNLFVLKANMTSAVVDAGEQCSPSSDDTGTWDFPGNNTIVLNGEHFTIKSFDGHTLKMADTYTEDEETVTLNITYVKQ